MWYMYVLVYMVLYMYDYQSCREHFLFRVQNTHSNKLVKNCLEYIAVFEYVRKMYIGVQDIFDPQTNKDVSKNNKKLLFLIKPLTSVIFSPFAC